MRGGAGRPEEDEVSEYVFARALYPSIHVHSSVLTRVRRGVAASKGLTIRVAASIYGP